MAKTSGQLKIAVAGFMQRDPVTFVRTVSGTSWDVLLQAMNNARLYAERLIDFELSKKSIQITGVSLLNGGNLANATLLGTNTAVSVKKIITPFLPIQSDVQQFPVDLISKIGWNNRIKRRFEGARPTDTSDYAFITDAPFAVMQTGNTLAIVPPDSTAVPQATFTLYADAVCWLPDYTSAGTENDFLLDFAFDWLMYQSIQELNFFVKEDERVTLSAAMVNRAWNSVVQYNQELIASTVDDLINLD